MSAVSLSATDLNRLSQNIWRALFREELELCASEPPSADDFASACIWIHGAWEGLVVLRSAIPLAHELSRRMLGLDESDDSDMCDTLGEVTNLVAGAVQALLPAPSELTPPMVIEGRDGTPKLPHSTLVNEVHFGFHGYPVTVTIFEAPRPYAGAATLRGNGEAIR